MRTFIHRSLLAAACGILAHAVPLAALAAQTPPETGFIISKEGEWFALSGASAPLAVGQTVREGDSVWVGRGRGAGDFLSIALYDGGGRFEVRCSRPATCEQRHAVPADEAGEGWVRRWMVGLADIWGGGAPRGYVPTITRNRPSPREAILVRDSGTVDLAPALRPIRPGVLRLEAAALDTAAVPGEWRPLQVDWNPGSPALVPADSLPPGLYALRRGGRSDGWVLVVDPSPESAEAAARFHEFSTRVREWRGGAGYVDARTVLRAVLHQLAFRPAEPAVAP